MSKPLYRLHESNWLGENRLGNSIFLRCRLCEEIFVILFPLAEQLAYEASCLNGVDKRRSLAFAAPNLSTNDRDLMASGYCTQCLDDMTEVTPFIAEPTEVVIEGDVTEDSTGFDQWPEPHFNQGPEEDDNL